METFKMRPYPRKRPYRVTEVLDLSDDPKTWWGALGINAPAPVEAESPRPETKTGRGHVPD